MANKENIESPGGEKQKKKKKQEVKNKSKAIVNYNLLSRWVQEQMLKEIPELGYISEQLIERILRAGHKYYVAQGYTSIKLADK